MQNTSMQSYNRNSKLQEAEYVKFRYPFPVIVHCKTRTLDSMVIIVLKQFINIRQYYNPHGGFSVSTSSELKK